MFRLLLPLCIAAVASSYAPTHEVDIPSLDDTQHDVVIHTSPCSGAGEDYRQGHDEAAVQIVVFSDFQCRPCKGIAGLLHQLMQDYQDRVLLVFKNYPLGKACNPNMEELEQDFHKFACEIAAMGRCAGKFGKFWEFHDIALTNQDDASSEAIKQWATDAGLDAEQLESCRDSKTSKAIAAKITADIDEGDTYDLRGTPLILINGREYVGSWKIETLRAVLDKLLHTH